jgi:hypothetical protein
MGKQAYAKKKRLITLNHIHNWWQTEGKDMHASKCCPPLTCILQVVLIRIMVGIITLIIE